MSDDTVRGERGPPFVSTTRSLQSRVSSIMACGLMILLGVAMLTWYYTNALSRQSRAKQRTQIASARKVQGEMPLPSIEGLNSMKAPEQPAPPQQTSLLQQPSPPEQPSLPQQLPLMPAASTWGTPGMAARPASYGHVSRKSADQLTLERLLAGAAFARESGARAASSSAAFGALPTAAPNGATAFGATPSGPSAAELGALPTAAPGASPGPLPTADSTDSDIAPLLRPVTIVSARAQVLPTRRFLLSKGTFIDCTLETAIDSTLPGMTTCITATDTFSSDGTVVLIERGTKLIGETRGQMQQGVARVFVLWTEARTPVGIVVPLDSPGTDALGRSGLSGAVNRHFWDRFGAAILISTLDGAVQAAVQSASRGGGPIIYNPSSSASVVTDVLKNSVNIPPTLIKQNGDRIQVFVARDVDFRSVYELRPIPTAR